MATELLAAGEHLWYVPTAVVYHAVPEERLRRKAIRSGFGTTTGVPKSANPDAVQMSSEFRDTFLTAPKIALTVLPRRAFRWIASADPKRRFFYKGMVWMTFGQMAEMPRLCQANSIASCSGLHPVDTSENAR